MCRGEAVQQSDLVVEAIVENLKIKQELFKFLDGKAQYVLYSLPCPQPDSTMHFECETSRRLSARERS